MYLCAPTGLLARRERGVLNATQRNQTIDSNKSRVQQNRGRVCDTKVENHFVLFFCLVPKVHFSFLAVILISDPSKTVHSRFGQTAITFVLCPLSVCLPPLLFFTFPFPFHTRNHILQDAHSFFVFSPLSSIQPVRALSSIPYHHPLSL